MRLKGRGAVITGGGRGIGEAVARELAGLGASVLVAARSTEQVEAVAASLRADGLQAHSTRLDVCSPESIEALAETARQQLGSVDILINNAGVAPSAPISRQSLEDWERTLSINTTGTFLCTKALLPGMLERGWGRIVNIASVASRMGAAYISAYAASKHAVLGFSRSVAMEVAAKGVTVNCVCPGYVWTDMTEASLVRMAAKTGKTRDELVGHLEEQSPQGRLMEAEEVAYLVGVLCDERSKGINGQGIVIDGGGVQG